MREALALDVVVLYLPRLEGAPERAAVHHLGGGERRLPAARRRRVRRRGRKGLAVASGAPIVFRDEASWLVPSLPAAQSWLVLPLVSERRLVDGGGRRRGAARSAHGRDRADAAR